MCGFYGKVGVNPNDNSVLINKELLRHRGPDNYSFHYEDHFFLAHNRLSIQDLSENANQPYTEDDITYLLFNGEIYNHNELRARFLKGEDFRTHSDTETIYKLINKHGIDIIKQFDGIFSLAFFNAKHNKVTILVDRLSIKPLFYMHDKSGFYFGSEIKTILHMRKKQYKINEKSLNEYLYFGNTFRSESIFKDIFASKPGEIITYSLEEDSVTHSSYYKVDELFNEKKRDQLSINDIKESVNAQLISDVGISMFLSGGIDSSVVSRTY